MGMVTVIITFIVPVLYIFGGILCVIRAPSYRCRGPAYKTKRAVLSRNTWHYANHNFGVVCIFIGIYILVLTGLADAIFWRIDLRSAESVAYCIIAVVIQAVLLLLPFYNTEQHLKDFFDDKGNPLFEEKKLRFLNRKNEEDWDDWKEPPEEKDDDWDDWPTWLHKRDIELDREREKKEAEERQAAAAKQEAEESFDEELEKFFAELDSVVTDSVVTDTEATAEKSGTTDKNPASAAAEESEEITQTGSSMEEPDASTE